MTAHRFNELVTSDDVTGKIKAYRANLPLIADLKKKAEELRSAIDEKKVEDVSELKRNLQDLTKEIRRLTSFKSSLPVLMYQAHFDESVSRKGFRGCWRKQSAARLNGLFMLDVDHVENVKESIEKILSYTKVLSLDILCDAFGILLVHVTPSGHGLRFVAKADAEIGNLADNQIRLSKLLGVEPDEACKDASRCSFCPSANDILFINTKELFTYENSEYDENFGPQYRKNNSQPTVGPAILFGDAANGDSLRYLHGIAEVGQIPASATEKDAGSDGVATRLERGYHGVGYGKILDEWFRQNNGCEPQTGDRHRVLYQAACDLRYICDFDAKLLSRILSCSKAGTALCDEGSGAELDRISADACALPRYRSIPKRMQGVLAAVGALQPQHLHGAENFERDTVDYEGWYKRLRDILPHSKGYYEACKPLPGHHQLAGVLASGAMFGTYLSRCWWEHFDGKEYRLSFLVYIIGGAASGKSFIVDLDRLIMAPMLAADKVGREWERQYKEEMKKRSASGSKTKGEAPEQQHPVIRYVPSTISNAMLYKRLMDAVDIEHFGPDGEALHLHCYTMEPELATALRAQQGSWAGKNDIELKAFHNEYAGVDFANEQSVNGVIQVNWNQVVSGTQEAMSRKIKPSLVLDGLVTRLCLFCMPSNDFAMIERRKAVRDHERESYLRSIGLKLEQLHGELKVPRLVDYCYKYEEQLTNQARVENDYCLDYFRKRIPVIMMRYTIVRIVLREIDELLKGATPTVTDEDLEFAKLVGDWCLFAQIHMFGEMVMQAQEREKEAFVPRKRSTKVREMYAALPMELSTNVLVENGYAADLNAASLILRRWLDDGLIEKTGTRSYKKKYKEIPV